MSDFRPPPARERPAASKPVVVLLDDEPRILSSLGRLLRSEPLELLATDQPERALEWLRTRSVRRGIADYRMPTTDGVRFLEEVRQLSPSTNRILLTGHPGDSVLMSSLDRGLLEIVAKPWDNDRFKALVRTRLFAAQRADAPGTPRAS
jgi:DNA-binding NtrC family response regulator